MCRNIKALFNFDPPATKQEIDQAALQFVRKLSGFNKPSKINEEAFNKAIKEVSSITQDLLKSLQTDANPKNREIEAEHARVRALLRFGTNK